MEKLVEVSDQVVCIDFLLGTKCRATVRLQSLTDTTPLAFKVQTSAPDKFLVNPPTGILPPLSQTTLQFILKPQPQIPSSFPRSPSDRFLIRTSTHHHHRTTTTHDVKLKVAFVGPFLLRHAVNNGDCDAVRSMVKLQPAVLTGLATREAESLYRVATADMVGVLLESGLRLESSRRGFGDKGWSELHAAAACGRTAEVVRMVEAGWRGGLDGRDREGRTALYVAASKGHEGCVRALAVAGGDVEAKCNDGRTALYRAAAKGERRMVKVLIEVGADPCTVADNRGRSAIDVARDEGHKEVVETLERGEQVVDLARRGEVDRLESLLEREARVDFRDQYGLTAIHMAAIKGHKDVVMLLAEFGSDLECVDVEGRTPLHLAVAAGSGKDMVEVLINRGAKVNAKCNRGATPLQVAQTMGNETIAQFLLLHGAIS